MDYERRFGGIARLYGEAALKKFAGTHVVVVGIGGVGSWAVEALARSAIGRLTLYDLDQVAESNVNRQLPAMDGTFGRAKIDVMRERVGAINPECRSECVEDFVEAGNITELLDRKPDYVLDCIDNFRTKAALIATCRRNKVPVITVGGAGGQIDPSRIRVVDMSRTEHDPLLSKTRKLLRREYNFSSNTKRRFGVPAVFSTEQQVSPDQVGAACEQGTVDGSLNCGGYGSAMPVTATFGLVAVAHLLQLIAKK